ncbi:MAG: uroporphyrinogen decarboxylase family protein [Armatimonadota bacterium]
MSGKELVSRVMAGEVPERVPIGEYAIDSDTVERILGHETYLRAKAKTRLALWEGRRDEVAQSWREDLAELHRKLPIFDIVNLAADCTALLPPAGAERAKYKKIDDSTYVLENGDVYKYSPPTRDLVLVQKGDGAPEAEELDETCFEVYDAVIAELSPEFFIIGASGPEVGMLQLGDTEETLLAYAMEPDVVRVKAEEATEAANAQDAIYARDGVDAIMWGQDHSYKSGPMISPAMFRDLVLPVYKSRVESVRRSMDVYIFKHACGNNWKLLEMYVEAGFDAYQSIQSSAGMDLAEVKKAYGEKLVLWGGVPLELLQSGSQVEVREAARSALQAGKPGGRYILGSTHSIATGTKYDNFMAMLDEYEKHCRY